MNQNVEKFDENNYSEILLNLDSWLVTRDSRREEEWREGVRFQLISTRNPGTPREGRIKLKTNVKRKGMQKGEPEQFMKYDEWWNKQWH